ncbi:MAG TPA: YdcF family protein [Bryobacteraceae bacterium]|nr:YdcF family protein [Bryobacteraceae bacterium]
MIGRLWRILRGCCVAFGLTWVLVTVTPVTKWYGSALAGPWLEPDGDILIVLGADGPIPAAVGLASYWRSVYAVYEWKRGVFRTVVVSGGNGVADSMKDYLTFEGIPADKIVLERRSTSTRENALFTADLLARMPGRKVLLTSDFHSYRSVRAFRKAGVDATPRPFPYAIKRAQSWADRWPVFLELCEETAKIVWYRLRGWI